ncbi:DUF2605 family protein [Parasynechococcus sp.]|uniref:DUF2605 family protein n=1 Tax=Parasynechococcus sp. TaxID=3101203 RepID=UPI0037046944
MGETRGHHVGESTNREAGALLDELLASLLADFEHWFQRGEELLQTCPDDVMPLEERQRMDLRLQDGKKAIAATRALVAASTQPMAISMEVMNPWHGVVTEVWALAAKLGSSRPPQAPS